MTRLGLVARPQTSSLAEASRTADDLAEAGVGATHLVINGILPLEADADALADAIRAEEAAVIAGMPPNLTGLTIDRMPLRSRDVTGLEALATLLSETPDHAEASAAPRVKADEALETLATTIQQLARREHGLVMVVGKGGVGKTTMAAAIAVGLSDRGKDVLLTTTDPAAHLAWTVGDSGAFEVSSIDPARAVAEYRRHVMETKGASLDAEGRANLAEDLRSPCTEEVAVFQAFSKAVAEARRRFVVMDTAPTGHTLLLMDATGSYHREVVRNLPEQAGITPLARLQDPENTAVIVVTLPEITPVLEASGLAADLARADIATWGWVVNRALTPTDTVRPAPDPEDRRGTSAAPAGKGAGGPCGRHALPRHAAGGHRPAPSVGHCVVDSAAKRLSGHVRWTVSSLEHMDPLQDAVQRGLVGESAAQRGGAVGPGGQRVRARGTRAAQRGPKCLPRCATRQQGCRRAVSCGERGARPIARRLGPSCAGGISAELDALLAEPPPRTRFLVSQTQWFRRARASLRSFGLNRRRGPTSPSRYGPVTESGLTAIWAGVPEATTLPPCSPPPGPRSMT